MISIIIAILCIWSIVAYIRFLRTRRNFPICIKQDNGDYFHYLRDWMYLRRRKYLKLASVHHQASALVNDGSYVKRGTEVVCVSGNVRPTGKPKYISFKIKAQKSGYIQYKLEKQGINQVLFIISSSKPTVGTLPANNVTTEQNEIKDFKNLWPNPVSSNGNDLILSSDFFDAEDKKKHNPTSEYFKIVNGGKSKEYSHIEEGDIIGYVAQDRGIWLDPVIFEQPLYAHKSGYVGPFNKKIKVNEVVCQIYDSIESLVQSNILRDSEVIHISTDDFTKSIVLSTDVSIPIGPILLSVIYRHNNLLLHIEYNTDSSCFISKDDTISFLFDNGENKTICVKNPPIRGKYDSKKRVCEICIYRETFELFTLHLLEKIKISGSSHEDIIFNNSSNNYPADVSKIIIKHIMLLYEKTLDDNHISIINELEQQTNTTDAACFVYIMKDEKNGCHKIGISNKPEYREKTLQSDKPFITMLKAKEFPSRKIAKAFEQALHKTYQIRHIRGEWFELSQEEVSEVISALN